MNETETSHRKYTNIEVLKTGYVSSSCDYFIDVSYQRGSEGRYCSTYCLAGGFVSKRGWDNAKPQYMLAEVKRQIALLVQEDGIKWHEYDKDGNKRYNNLRYYDRELLLEMVKGW